MKYLFLIIFLFSAYISTAQTEKDTTTTKKTESRIKVYQPSSSTESNANNDTYKWVIKTDYVGLITSEIPIMFEYRIAKKFSVEAAAGITYSFWRSLAPDFFTESGNLKTVSAIGPAYRATFKYYPSTDYDAIEGIFFGVQGFYFMDNYDYKGNTEELQKQLDGKTESQEKYGASIIVGAQGFSNSNISTGFYVSLGVGQVSKKYYTINSTDPNKIDPKFEQKIAAVFMLGATIGFGN